MADEQIKQNAEICVFTENSFRKAHKKLILTPSEEKIAKDFYIAGAHSRDEEITRLSAEIEDDNYVISKLREELDQLRNPWIPISSLPNRDLPDDDFEHSDVSEDVLVMFSNGSIRRARYDFDEQCWKGVDYIITPRENIWKKLL